MGPILTCGVKYLEWNQPVTRTGQQSNSTEVNLLRIVEKLNLEHRCSVNRQWIAGYTPRNDFIVKYYCDADIP